MVGNFIHEKTYTIIKRCICSINNHQPTLTLDLRKLMWVGNIVTLVIDTTMTQHCGKQSLPLRKTMKCLNSACKTMKYLIVLIYVSRINYTNSRWKDHMSRYDEIHVNVINNPLTSNIDIPLI